MYNSHEETKRKEKSFQRTADRQNWSNEPKTSC